MAQTKRKTEIEFEGLPGNPLLTPKRRAALRRRYGHRANPFRKGPASMYLPRKVHTALMKRLRAIDKHGGYTTAYELLVDAAELMIDW